MAICIALSAPHPSAVPDGPDVSYGDMTLDNDVSCNVIVSCQKWLSEICIALKLLGEGGVALRIIPFT